MNPLVDIAGSLPLRLSYTPSSCDVPGSHEPSGRSRTSGASGGFSLHTTSSTSASMCATRGRYRVVVGWVKSTMEGSEIRSRPSMLETAPPLALAAAAAWVGLASLAAGLLLVRRGAARGPPHPFTSAFVSVS